MRSVTSPQFWDAYLKLPEGVQRRARQAYRLFRQNPAHPSLNFKKVDEANSVYSVRVGLSHRALGRMEGTEIVWFWIGTHAEYDRRL